MFGSMSAAIIQFRGVTPWDRYPWFQVLRPYTQLWIHNAYQAGGTLQYSDIQLAENWLAQPIYQAGMEGKICALYPFLGDFNAARCPLHDLRGTGPAGIGGSTGFTNSTLGTTALGLTTSNLSSVQYLETNLTPNQVAGVVSGATALPAGLGFYLRSAPTFNTTGTEAMGCYTENQAAALRFSIDLRSTPLQAGRWGTSGNGPSVSSTAGAADYYIEASSSTRRDLYRDATSIANNTTADATSGSRLTITIGGCKIIASGLEQIVGFGSTTGRIGVAYLTLGNLGSSGVTTFHNILLNFCTAAGR